MRPQPATAPPAVPGAAVGAALRRRERLWLAGLGAVLVVYAVTAVAYALSVPVGRSADELSHLNYARLIADHGALPGADVLERQQPPLYYMLAAGLLKLGVSEQGVRLMSVVFGLGAIVAVAATARVVAPRRPWLAVGAAAVVGLLPGFQDLGGSISNDPLAIAVGAVLLLLTVMVLASAAPTGRLLLAIGVMAGVALLAKETDWSVLLVLATAVGYRWRGRLRATDLPPLLGPPVLIAGWWFVRNVAEFHRPLPPLNLLAGQHEYLRSVGKLRGFVSETLRDLFGPERFQGGLVTLPDAGDTLVVLLAGALLGSLLLFLILAARQWRQAPRLVLEQGLFLGGAFVLAILADLANSVAIALQPQARYLLVAVSGPALAVAWAWAELGRTRPLEVRVVVTVVVVAALALSAIGIHAAATAPG